MTGEAAHRAHQYPLLWLLLAGATGLALIIAVDQNLMSAIFAADRSYLCILILAIFFAASLHVGVHTFSVARQLESIGEGNSAWPSASINATTAIGLLPRPVIDEFFGEMRAARAPTQADRQQILEIFADRLRAPVELGWYIVDILIRLGLIGTIIGFIMIFASLSSGQPSSENIQSLLLSMSGGMGTALYTTLVGMVCATLLGIQYMILGRSVERLIGCIIRLGQHDDAGKGNA